MMEIPFPMPNSVICSPSHMTSAEPAVKVITMTMAAQTAGASDTMIPLPAHKQVVAVTLNEADADRGVTGDGSDLLLALFAALFAQPLERRDSDAQELDDDGGVDVGLDAQSKGGSPGRTRRRTWCCKVRGRCSSAGQSRWQECWCHIRHGHGLPSR